MTLSSQIRLNWVTIGISDFNIPNKWNGPVKPERQGLAAFRLPLAPLVDTLVVGKGSDMAEHADLTKLEKHDAVLTLLVNLEERLGRGAFQVVDHWETDFVGVGIAHPSDRELLAYIAVYGPDDFYLELERPPQPGSELPYSVGGEFRCATFDEVVQIVAKHLASGSHQ